MSFLCVCARVLDCRLTRNFLWPFNLTRPTTVIPCRWMTTLSLMLILLLPDVVLHSQVKSPSLLAFVWAMRIVINSLHYRNQVLANSCEWDDNRNFHTFIGGPGLASRYVVEAGQCGKKTYIKRMTVPEMQGIMTRETLSETATTTIGNVSEPRRPNTHATVWISIISCVFYLYMHVYLSNGK